MNINYRLSAISFQQIRSGERNLLWIFDEAMAEAPFFRHKITACLKACLDANPNSLALRSTISGLSCWIDEAAAETGFIITGLRHA